MLRELSVQNLALIENARIELHDGYCAWTGETGAGKSLLLTALGLVLGGKATTDGVRAGKPEARAAATFDLDDPGLRAEVEAILGGPVEGDQLIITRRIMAQGRGSAHVNGLPVPATTLRELGRRLVDIHGQHETRGLLDPDRQRALLDAHGGLRDLAEDFQARRTAHDELRRRRNALARAAERRARERDLLAFEAEELADADPRPGEYEDLTREASRLGSRDQLRAVAAEGFACLYDDDLSAQGRLQRIARLVRPFGDDDPDLRRAAAELERLADETREIAYTLRAFGREGDADPGRLEDVESRLATYRKLAARFRCTPDELLARREAIDGQLASLAADDADLERLDAPLRLAWDEVRASSGRLSAARVRAAKGFAEAVQLHLRSLGLEEATLAVEVEPIPLGDDPCAASAPEGGADRVTFRFSANPGEAPKPLGRVASGGELSRVMLAIKVTVAGVEGARTLVFDEIDAGVGGRLGSALGRMLAGLARHHQVICITHLPQMASYARHQWVIRKETVRGRTRTKILPLDEAGRIEELAQMLRGDSAAEGTRREAHAMLSEGSLAT